MLGIRVYASEEEIKSFTPESLVAFIIDNGLILKDAFTRADISLPEISGSSASAVILANGQVTPMKYHFHRENGFWKLDITSVLKMPFTNLTGKLKKAA